MFEEGDWVGGLDHPVAKPVYEALEASRLHRLEEVIKEKPTLERQEDLTQYQI